MTINYGINLLTVDDFCDTDMDYAFSRLNEFGYKFVEFYKFYDNKASELKEYLEKWSMTVLGADATFSDLEDNFDAFVNYNKELGNENIIINDVIDTDKVNKLANKLKEQGLNLVVRVCPKCIGDVLSNTTVKIEIDTYAFEKAGVDVCKCIYDNKDRLFAVHFRDGKSDTKPMPLGDGDIELIPVLEKCLELDIPMVVDSRGFAPDGVANSKKCYKFFRKYREEKEAQGV